MSENDFDRLLLQAVDDGLSSIGESSKQAIYFHLDKSFKIKRHEIPCKIEDFKDAMEKIFGLGASFVEILIMKKLYEKVGGCFEWHGPQDLTFTEYVTAVRRSFLTGKGAKSMAEELVQCKETATET